MRSLTRNQFLGALLTGAASRMAGESGSGVQKEKDIVIYSDPKYYATFPSMVRRPGGEILVAFRRCPERRPLGNPRTYHADPNGYLVMVRSKDNGETWTKEPSLILAHPYGSSQDPCMVQLDDGSIICTSYLWEWVGPFPKLPPRLQEDAHTFLGGFLLRSQDGGRSWQGPYLPPPIPERAGRDFTGNLLPASNRGAMCQGRNGRLYWAVASTLPGVPTEIHLMTSDDRGLNWQYSCPIAADGKVAFNETSLYETPKGDILAFVRTAGFDDHTVVVRSTDGGKSFGRWQDAGFQGHPQHAVRLPDNRVWLVYGYRHPPFGVRARVLNAECTDFASAPEYVLRDEGGTYDLGYPWAVTLPGNRVLSVYYFNRGNGTRYIAGTIVRIAP